jgi:hypothetical protein
MSRLAGFSSTSPGSPNKGGETVRRHRSGRFGGYAAHH